MLVRALRLTDKLGNALLRVAVYLGDVLLVQLYRLRLALGDVLGVFFNAATKVSAGRVVLERNLERRRQIMARRAAELATRTVVREDPLKVQNRALSIFTMLLLLMLIGLVLWFTSTRPTRPVEVGLGGVPIQLATTPPPTDTPTPSPSETISPNPLQGGSVVYSLRENGRDQLWAFTIGKGNPVRLTNSANADNRDPVWSPDGTRIAFASNRDGNWELYVLDMTTGQSRRLTSFLAYKGAPTWSPDGAFLAYESYENENLDIFIVAADGSSTPQQLTRSPAPDFSPAWYPAELGRRIAYVSLRDGNNEVYVIDLNSASEFGAQRITSTPAIDEDHPVFSPDGTRIAYSGRINGVETVFVKRLDQVDVEPRIVGLGSEPAWSPDSNSVMVVQRNTQGTLMVGVTVEVAAGAAVAVDAGRKARNPSWTRAELPPALLAGGGVPAPNTPPLCVDGADAARAEPPYHALRPVTVIAPAALLSDRVDESFNSLRAVITTRAGFDFLGTLSDLYWDPTRLPEPGQPRDSWHYAGRAFAFDRNLVFNAPAPIEVVREDVAASTQWRVFVRVAGSVPAGQLGEPLRRLPWDFASRTSGDAVAFEQGGRPKSSVPAGYFIDLTDLADDCGWTRVPSEPQWRSNYSSLLYWQFDKRSDGRGGELSWEQAMLEIMSRADLQTFLNAPTPVPTRRADATDTPRPRRTATPVPPA